MATAAVTNTFVASTPAEAAEVNTNFTDLVTFLNNSVVHADGSKAMTANFDAGSNKLTNVALATAAADSPRLDQVVVGDYKTTSSPTVITTSATTLVTLTVYSAAAGMATLYLVWDVTTSGVTTYAGGGGESGMDLDLSLTGSTWISPSTAPTLLSFDSNTNSEGSNRATPYLISLSAGTNTIVVQLTRVNNGSTTTNGTATVATGFKAMIMGA